MNVLIQPSEKKDKKNKATIDNRKTVHFGAAGMSDYTKHKDPARKQRYIDRHQKKESWGKDGIETAGFYSKHVLWNLPSLRASVQDLNKNTKT